MPKESLDLNSNDRQENIIEKFSNGSYYKGQKKDNLRNGYGKFYYEDGGLYDGNWENNCMNGFGTLYYQNGSKAYQGNWKNDKFEGNGTLYNEEPVQIMHGFDYTDFSKINNFWLLYEGQFSNDDKNGQGMYQFTNGEKFIGNFTNDKVNGQGQFITITNQVINAIWKNDKLISYQQ